MLTCMHAIKNWTQIWIHRLLLQSHNLLSKSTMLLAILMIEREKGVGKGKEVGAVVPIEVAIMIIKGVVASMMQARDLPDMAKGARVMVTMGVRVTAIREVKTLASHPTSPLNLSIRISSKGSSKDSASNITTKETRVELIVGMETVVVAIVVLEVAAIGVMGCLTTYMEQATGRPSALPNLSVRSAADLT